MTRLTCATLLVLAGCSGSSGGTLSGSGNVVLFDAGHKQTVGNAYWIVDKDMPAPSPGDPSKETDWSGAISAWGFDLFDSRRYAVSQLPEGSQLTFGDGGDFDLQKVKVFVSVEPELKFSADEQKALMQFANAGGGIFLVADHKGAKRCSDCVEAWQVLNDFLQGEGSDFGLKVDGNSVGSSGLKGTVTSDALAGPIGSGPFGKGTTLEFHSGSTVSAPGGKGKAAVVIDSASGGLMASAELPSGGRMVLLGDSSPPDDGTCDCSANVFKGWDESDHKALILNATAWLAHDGS